MRQLTSAAGRCSSFLARALLVVAASGLLAIGAPVARAANLTEVNTSPPARPSDRRLHDLLATSKGKPVLINFWASWCQPCQEEMPSLHRVAKRYRDRGLVVATVAVADNAQNAADFLWANDIELPLLLDPAQGLSIPWGARALPTTVILDRRHRIRLRGQGAIDWDAVDIDRRLETIFK